MRARRRIPAVRYRRLEDVARWTIVGLALVAVMDVAMFVTDYLEYALFDRIVSGEHFTLDEAEASDSRQEVVGFITLGVFVVTVVLFLRWFHRVPEHSRARGSTAVR